MPRRLLAASVVAAIAIAACGEEDEAPPAVAPVGDPVGGSVVQYADCADWRKGSAPARRATVVELRRQLTPQTSKTAESPLPDDRAYEILDEACKPGFAKSLRLYKLYVRAQGFAPLSE